MKLHELSFAKIIILQDDIAEVIINEGVEMDEPMVDAYHAFLREHLSPPIYLLVNKINAYSYDFNAQMKLATIDEIAAMAVVAYSRTTHLATDGLLKFPRKKQWNLKIFSDRESALQWLLSYKTDQPAGKTDG